MSRKTRKSQSSWATGYRRFREVHLSVIHRLVLNLTDKTNVCVTTKLIGWAIFLALTEARYADAVELAGRLSQQQYESAHDHSVCVQLASMVKKVPFLDPNLDPEATARQKFDDAERACEDTNRRLTPWYLWMNGYSTEAPAYEGDPVLMLRVLERARREVYNVLGNKPDIARLIGYCRFSGGTAIGVTGNRTNVMAKWSSDQWTCTPGARPLAEAAARQHPHVWEALLGVPYCLDNQLFAEKFRARTISVSVGKIFFVPKEATTHRSVEQQPLFNLYLQLGTGDWMRERLKSRLGICLKYGWKLNQELAHEGSLTPVTFVTEDLKSASDTVATMLCRLLLPSAWFDWMDGLRTKEYVFEGDENPRAYHKFVAMGNGFAFPLETLLFAALVKGVYAQCVIPDGRFAVYGDDIAVHAGTILLLREVFTLCGFTSNTTKSYAHGPFRESCGKDFFRGVPVRPFVLDKIPGDWSDYFLWYNSFRSVGMSECADVVFQNIPPKHRLTRPIGYGEGPGAMEVPLDQFMATRHAVWDKDFQSWRWRERKLQPEPDIAQYTPPIHMIGALCGAEALEKRDRKPYRDNPANYRMDNPIGTPVFALRRETRYVSMEVPRRLGIVS